MPLSQRTGQAVRLFAVLLLCLATGIFLYRTTWATERFQYDDAFIAFRIAKNIGHGIGPYFNPGGPERTNTSIIHPYLLSLFFQGSDDAGIERTAWLDILTFLATTVLMSVGAAAIIKRRFGLNPDLVFTLTFLLIVSRLNVMYGMETQLYTLLIAATFWLFTRERHSDWAFALACLGPFIRPDGALLPLVVLISVLIFKKKEFDYKKQLPIGAGLAVLYVALNLHFYHTLMPHTAMVKSLLFRDKWHEAEVFFREMVLPHNIPTYIVPFSLLGLFVAFRDRGGFILAAFLVAYAAFFTGLNTWFYTWYRVPVQLILDVCAALGFAFAFSIVSSFLKMKNLRLAAAGLAILVCGFYFGKSLKDAQLYLHQKVAGFHQRVLVAKQLGQYLRHHVPAGQAAFLEPMGIIGFYAWPVAIKDFPGLASLEVYECLKGYGSKPLFFYEQNADNLFYLLKCVPGIPYTLLREREYRIVQPFLDSTIARPCLTVHSYPEDAWNDTFFRVFRTEDLLKARKLKVKS